MTESPPGKIIEMMGGLAPNDLGLLRQHDAELGEQAADAVEGGGASRHVALARAVAQPRQSPNG